MQHSNNVNWSEYTITSKAETKPMINDDKLFKLDGEDNIKILVKKHQVLACQQSAKIKVYCKFS